MALNQFEVERFGSEDGGLSVRCRECDAREAVYGRFDREGYFENEDGVQSWESAHKCDVCLICGYADGIAGTENLIHEDCYNDNRPLGHALIVAHQSALEAAMWAEIDAAVAK